MSVNPSEGSGSEVKWFGEDFEQIDRFGRSVPGFGEADAEVVADLKQKGWKDEAADQLQLQPESNQQRPAPVTMETASTAIDLLYWRDLKQTGILLAACSCCSSLSPSSAWSASSPTCALAALSATISFRIYKSVLQAIQKTGEGHPFKAYLDLEISLSQEQIQKYADNAQLYLNSTMKELRRLFLVQDLVDSLKFAVLMWLLAYVGALFNGLTLLIMAVISMFTMPVVYEKYQAQIDQYLGLVRTHVNSVVGKIQAKIPGAKSKAE
ncbi:reticulon-1-A isoform X3 [Acipenser oxyrinchus oxyrinchus]|uniref:Reticulon n=1 Tax=Acipenser oxyrinchus oxyrinchus TaxID=40147 RepID=A0AAD8FPF2_ACIOX|nr:reticulon-1-A isoform X3 [Acipenser oxyrinchus oxyrinchus]